MLPTDLLSYDDRMIFIVDSGASRTSTFKKRDFIPGTFKMFEKPPALIGISGTLEIKRVGDIQFQVAWTTEI